MNKAELKIKWGKYTDTNKLVDDIMELLEATDWEHTEHGVCTMLNEYFTNKEPLIKLFQKSNHYAGDMRIVTHQEIMRNANRNDVYRCAINFSSRVNARNIILSKVDEHGKKYEDYLRTGVKHFNALELENETFAQKFNETSTGLASFNYEGFTKASEDKLQKFHSLMNIFAYITYPNLSQENANDLRNTDERAKFLKGNKTTRAFNRVCNLYGVDNAPNYGKAFSEYGEKMCCVKRNYKYVISLNPYDYLTMSFGDSWQSCHSIRSHGIYCAGTQSYMLDGTSIVTYCVEDNGDVQRDGKIYRNMFHYNIDFCKLIQGRIYPQANDGDVNLYEVFRGFMHEELSELIELENNQWTATLDVHATSFGQHYKDYNNFRECNTTFPLEKYENGIEYSALKIGHNGICVNCGQEHSVRNRINHGNC